MTNLSKLLYVPNTEQNLSVRISMCFSSMKKEILRHCEAPLLRVGRFLIYRVSVDPLKSASEERVTLRRMLILGSKFPDFLKTYFKPKHSYSKGFGLGNANFTLRSVLDMYDKGSLSYTIDTNKTAAVACSRIIPAYVIHRYFPKFKGYARIAPSSLPYVMQRLGRCSTDEVNDAIKPLYLSDQEVYQISVRLHNAFMRCHDECPGRLKRLILIIVFIILYGDCIHLRFLNIRCWIILSFGSAFY